jgi:glycine/D-amino acid oxidase-like deaminating enzyme
MGRRGRSTLCDEQFEMHLTNETVGLISEATPISFSDDLPERADVVVIGGGVIGVTSALCLAEAGHTVALFEKGRIAGEQSSRNWGWIRQLGRDDAEMPIMMEATRLWQGMADRIGADVGYRAEGIIYLAESEATAAANEIRLATANRHQLKVERLRGADVEGRIQGRPGFWRGGLLCPSDGRAEPWIAVPRMAKALQDRGASVHENCAVRALETSAGRVSGVVTERGLVKADAVLIAGGAWTSLFLQRHGVFFPQLSVRATVARTAPAPNVYGGGAADSALAFRRREDGGYTLALTDHFDFFLGRNAFPSALHYAKSGWASRRIIALRPVAPLGYPDAWFTQRRWGEDELSPFERMRVLHPKPAPGATERIRKRMSDRFPALADIPIVESWAGMIDTMPDTVPTMDAVPSFDGLWVASGFSGHGFGIGPAAGRIMADLIQGRPVEHDLTRFRFDRFTDGSSIKPGPAI